MDCFCFQYIFLSTIRRTIFQVWGLYHKAFLNFAGKKSYGSVGNTSRPPSAPLLAYNSEVAKLALSKLLKIFTCGLMSIKKVLPPKNCSLEFYWEIHLYLSSQWISTIQLCLYHLQQYNSGKAKGGFVSDRRKSLRLVTGEAGPKQMIWKYPITYLLCRPGIEMVNIHRYRKVLPDNNVIN